MDAELLDWVGFATTDEGRLTAALDRHRATARPVEAAALDLLREAWSDGATADRGAIERKVRLLERELDRTPMPLAPAQAPRLDDRLPVAR